MIHAVTSSQKSVFPAIGEGEDVRFDGAGVLGTALAGLGKAIHVSAFPMEADAVASKKTIRLTE